MGFNVGLEWIYLMPEGSFFFLLKISPWHAATKNSVETFQETSSPFLMLQVVAEPRARGILPFKVLTARVHPAVYDTREAQ